MNATRLVAVFGLVLASSVLAPTARAEEDQKNVIRVAVQDTPLGDPAKFGFEQLAAEFKTRGWRLMPAADTANPGNLQINMGTREGSESLRALIASGAIDLATAPESLAMKWIGERALQVAGQDERGLMYALLDLADSVAHTEAQTATDWIRSVRDVHESPRNGMRRMRVLMHHAANEKDWYHSPEYWDWYIGMLATNRFNGLNLVYSHQSPYMAPMYAWHLKIDEFPDVKPIGVSDEEREENLKVLRHIAKLCHKRGIELTIGVWQHLPWMRSYLKSRPDQECLVEGLSGENIGRYTYLAVKKLIQECPGIARIQIRPNDESGINSKEQTAFYRDNVMRAIKESGSGVKLDLRTVGVQPTTIEAARKADLSVRTSIKFYGEFMGLPHTPREVLTRNYSYGGFLQKPHPNPVYNEVWVLGSHRVLLWGGEEYGRQFGRNASYGGTVGFETDGPMAQKGYQQSTGPAWRFFRDPNDEYYKHEIERYWGFFRAIGRFGYNPDTPHEVWLRPFVKRFPGAAEPMADAYAASSRVVGLIVASHVEDINMYEWPEISMGGLLSAYADLRGSDKGLFPSINEAVDEEMAGHRSGRIGPFGLADLYEKIATQNDQALVKAAASIKSSSKEYVATVNDFRILAALARYHAHRQREGYLMAKFYRTSDLSLLPNARRESIAAVEAWKTLLPIAERQYHAPMQTGPRENGHWKDKTFLVEANPKIIADAAATLKAHGVFDLGFDFGIPPLTQPEEVFSFYHYCNDYFNERRFIGMSPGSLYDPRLGYGFLDAAGLEAQRNPMVHHENLSGAAPLPDGPMPLDLVAADYVHSKRTIKFRTDLPMDGYRFTFVFADRSAKPRDHGAFTLQALTASGPKMLQENIRVPAGKSVIVQSDQHIRKSGWNPFWTFGLMPMEDSADAMLSGLTIHRQAPKLAHASLWRVSPAEPCSLSVTITMPPRPVSGDAQISAAPGERLLRATLDYRTAADQPLKSLPLSTKDGNGFIYSAQIPVEDLKGRWLEYAFSAVDKEGRVSRLPDASTNDFFRARLTADASPPKIEATPLDKAVAGQPLKIEAKITDPDGVAAGRVYFRRLDETLPYECLPLERDGDKYVATIPAEALLPDFDFVYYLEAIDEAGCGTYFPDWEKTAPYVIVPTAAK